MNQQLNDLFEDFNRLFSDVVCADADFREFNDAAEQREMLRNCAAHEQYERDRMAALTNDRR